MKLRLAILSLVIFGSPALAQTGVSNQRDMYGNITRNNGATSQGGINQSTPSNGAIRNPAIQPPINPVVPPKAPQINRSGFGTN